MYSITIEYKDGIAVTYSIAEYQDVVDEVNSFGDCSNILSIKITQVQDNVPSWLQEYIQE